MRTPTQLFLTCLAAAALLPAQNPAEWPQWIVPGRAVFAPNGWTPVCVTAAHAKVAIHDRAATTTLEFEVSNPASVATEAVLLVPVPEGAAVSSFSFDGAAAEPTARILPRDEARRLYDEITRRMRDPALLEFVDFRCLRSSVFPVPANGQLRLRLSYDHVLEADGNRVDYLLPRSEMLGHEVPWTIEVDLEARAPLALVYSPSHELATAKLSPQHWRLGVTVASQRDPGAFRLCFTTTADPSRPTASLFAYPDPKVGGGYFLLLAEGPALAPPPIRREVTLVLDRSGSMAGRKLEQTRAAALQVIEALADGEGIQLIEYGNTVGSAFAQPVAKTAETMAKARTWLANLRPNGGTNLHDALLEALRAPVLPDMLPLVLFLTDGIPTVGPTRESELRELVAKGNPHGRRVFCFGVGHDVNVPLLDRIAETTRAVTTYVQPEEDVELKVARTFARLGKPLLGEPVLHTVDAAGQPDSRVSDSLPARLPDLYTGDQLVVLGRYRGEADLHFELRGIAHDGERRFEFALPVAGATVRHAFVPRLWASRQIAFLVDELRQKAGDLGGPPQVAGADPFTAPHLRELRDEILRLSTEFGVLGEYTSFLATEGSRLDDWSALTTACTTVLQGRAVAVRSGIAAVNQGYNLWAQKGQERTNYANFYLDAGMQPVVTTGVQQVCDRALFKRGDRWIDSRNVVQQRLQPDETVPFASPRYFALVDQLAAQGRTAVLSLKGEVLLTIEGHTILFSAPTAEPFPLPTPAVPSQEIVR